MTPQGAVRALVGGKNYAESQFNRAVAAKRQPGSAFKPFVYLAALERGLTPETIREDKPIDVKGWKPENYSREYFGPVSLTKALAHSLNTVSVRLTLEVGPQAVVRTAHRLGIASKLEPNASIALGTSEVSVMELVSSYVPFANGGIAVAPHVIDKVRTAGGKLIYRAHNPGLGRVIDERTAAMMNQMMQETLTTGTARKADTGGFPAAGKTGTCQEFRDAWFVGYTGHLVAGVWLGNDDNSATKKLTGGGMPVDIWSRFMKAAHQGLPMADLPGMAGRAYDPTQQQAPPAPLPAPSSPITSMLSPAPAAPMAREDDMRAMTPMAPARPPAVAVAPIPQAPPRCAHRPRAASARRDGTAPRRMHRSRARSRAAAAALEHSASARIDRIAARASAAEGARTRRASTASSSTTSPAGADAPASRARTPRETAQSASVAHPDSASGIATGHALAPSNCPTMMPLIAAHTICDTPTSDDAVPARCGNGIMAPAMLCGCTSPMPVA